MSRLPHPARPPVAATYCAAAAVLTVVYFLLSAAPNEQHAVYQLFGVLGIWGIAAGIRRHRPAGPAWPLLLLGLVLWVSGDGYWNTYRLVTGHEAPFPSPADALYLLAYVPLLAAILVMVRGGRPRAADLVDAGIVGLAASLVVWFAAIAPATRAHQASTLSAVIADAYPTMDYLLVLALVQLLFTRARSVALRWLTAAFVTVLVTDILYAWLRSSGAFTTSSWVNAGYFWFYVMLGAGALSSSMVSLSGGASAAAGTVGHPGRLTLRRLALLATALVATPAAVLLQGTSADATGLVVIAVVGGVISLLVLVRLALLFLERDRIDAHRRRAEAALQHMAYFDGLTDLANRAALFRAIDDEIARAGADSVFALLFVDLDGFKQVNDRHGHLHGDTVLQETARRLRDAVRSADLVARHGGDEFVVLLRQLPDDDGATVRRAVDRITEAVGAPLGLAAAEPLALGASVGVSVYPADGTTADALIRVADRRMYACKAGRQAVTTAA